VNTGKLETTTLQLLVIVGQNIRNLRKQKGWTQEELAEASNINDKEVSHIEQGKRNITIATLSKIAAALETSAQKLLSS